MKIKSNDGSFARFFLVFVGFSGGVGDKISAGSMSTVFCFNNCSDLLRKNYLKIKISSLKNIAIVKKKCPSYIAVKINGHGFIDKINMSPHMGCIELLPYIE